jgi:TM2 domain-containing membrane protein YozV
VLHKNKTLTTFLAIILGSLGAHRLYLGGARDRWLWLHLACLPLMAAAALLWPGANWFYKILPLLLSCIASVIEALVIGLTPDEQWDARHNGATGQVSDSGWPIAALLVAGLMGGTIVLIGTMSRLFDLLYTGGSYG